MKKWILIIVLILLPACTQNPTAAPVATNTPAPTATQENTVDPQLQIIISNIKTTFSKGSHMGKFQCEKCHLDQAGALSKELVWMDENTGQLVKISDATQICIKCHADQLPHAMPAGSIPLAHANFECTNCHDAHNLQASCSESACHNDIMNTKSANIQKPEGHTGTGDPDSYMCGGTACHELATEVANTPIYHQPTHSSVPCYVCHDVSGLSVSLIGDQFWITTDDLGQTSAIASLRIVSHTIGTDVICTRCHSEYNAWNLSIIPPSN
jgi:hypothetical protein